MMSHFVCLALLVVSSQAFPSRPGSCDAVNPLGGFHLVDDRCPDGVECGSALSNFNIELQIDGETVDPDVPFVFDAGKALDITLEAAGEPFLGFLMRLDTPGISFLDVAEVAGGGSTDIQVFDTCTNNNVSGLAHTNRNPKTSVSGILEVDDATEDMVLEVTVVISNSGGVSEYYLSSYTLTAEAAGGGGFGTICFPGDSQVQVKDRGSVPMKSLEIGDHVLVDDKNTFEPIYSFGHNQADVSAQYLQLRTSSSKLEISRDHMVFVEGNHAVPASSVKVGDKLIMTTGGDTTETVQAIKDITRTGAFAPFTPSGTISVDGVKASSFVSLQNDSSVLTVAGISTGLSHQWVARTFEFPHRVWCTGVSTCISEKYDANGVSTWLTIPLAVFRWFVGQGAMVQTIVSVPVLAFFSVLGAAQMMAEYWSLTVALLVVLFGTAASFSVRAKIV